MSSNKSKSKINDNKNNSDNNDIKLENLIQFYKNYISYIDWDNKYFKQYDNHLELMMYGNDGELLDYFDITDNLDFKVENYYNVHKVDIKDKDRINKKLIDMFENFNSKQIKDYEDEFIFGLELIRKKELLL